MEHRLVGWLFWALLALAPVSCGSGSNPSPDAGGQPASDLAGDKDVQADDSKATGKDVQADGLEATDGVVPSEASEESSDSDVMADNDTAADGDAGDCGDVAAGDGTDDETGDASDVDPAGEQDVCTPDCSGKQCGDDGCGGLCGVCPEPEPKYTCIKGTCFCTPQCEGWECGDDGCGGSCGECDEGLLCDCGKCVEPPPPKLLLQLFAAGCGTPAQVILIPENLQMDAQEAGAECRWDEEPPAAVSGWKFESAKLANGYHQVCCTLTWSGASLPGCDASACIKFKVQCPCSKSGDPACNDGNPCTIDTCQVKGGALWECNHGWTLDPDCCLSDLGCGCTDGIWGTCDSLTNHCVSAAQ